MARPFKATIPPILPLTAANAEAVRETPPQQLFDHARAIQHAVDSGSMSAEEGAAATNALYTGGLGEQELTLSRPPAAEPAIEEPDHRPGGALGPTVFGADDIVELQDLTMHAYGSDGSEQNGLLYTCAAGFIDIGRVRDRADWTAYLAARVLRAFESGDTEIEVSPEAASRVTVHLTDDGQGLPGDEISRELAIHLGQRIAYDLALWHEITMWFQSGGGQKNDSFSPANNVSNLLGTYIGADAMRARKSFDAAVAGGLTARLSAYGAVSRPDTEGAFTTVARVWTDASLSPRDDAYLQRRHFDAFGTVTPWLVDGACGSASPTAVSLAVPEAFVWPATSTVTPLAEYYRLEIDTTGGVVPSGVLGGRPVITSADFPGIVRAIRALAATEFGSDAGSPTL